MSLFTLLLVTTMGTSQVPGLSDAECRWMVISAPLAVAEVSQASGRPIGLVRATCTKEDNDGDS